jgi:carbonic anhydrase
LAIIWLIKIDSDGFSPNPGSNFVNLAANEVCGSNSMLTPISFRMPFTVDLNADMPQLQGYKENVGEIEIYKIGTGAFRVDGDFGSIKYMGMEYTVEFILLKSPSEHTVGRMKLPLEMQIYHRNLDTKESVVTSVLFEQNGRRGSSLLERFAMYKGNKEIGELQTN